MPTRTIKAPKFINGAPTGDIEEIQVDDHGTASWGPKDQHVLVNTAVPRTDGPAKTTGAAKYTHDIRLPNLLHGRFITSPHAHAKITTLDASAALKIPGVKSVLPVVNVGGEVRFEGQPVVAIAATTPEIAEDAARAVRITYDKLPFVVTADDALKPNAPSVNPSRPGRQSEGDPEGAMQRRGNVQGNLEQAEAALKAADVTIDVEYRTPILHHCCLETHSCTVDYNAGADSATVYLSTQGTFTIPNDASRELGVPVKGVVHHMGGGFGSKFGLGIAGQWACRLSKAAGAPVKMLLTRYQEFVAAGNGPGSLIQAKAGASKDGTLVAMSTTQYSLPGIGNGNVSGLPYQYRAGTVYRRSISLNTHEDSSVPLRAPGHPQASFAMEGVMDELAYKLNMDPVEFRIKNLPKDQNGAAWTRQLNVGAKAIGWENRNPNPGKPAGDRGSLVRGMGCAIGAWGGGGRGGASVDVKINKDGSVLVTSGAQDLGTGTRTYVHSIVAEELGLPMSALKEEIGESSFPNGPASGGSTTAASLAPACKDAGVKARTEFLKAVAPLFGEGATPDALWIRNGYVIGNGKAVPFQQACAALPNAGLSVRGNWVNGLAGNGAHGATFAEVEVDLDTGHVRVVKMCHIQDGGLILNRLAAESQINGGMIQSLAMALYEGRIMDPNLGVMLNPGFGDYKLPGTMEIPELIPIIDDGDTRNVVMGIAEPANIPGCGAVANAVYNATGLRIRSTPITPDKILNALAKQKPA